MSAEQLPPVLPEDECGVDRQAPQEVRVQPEGAEGKRPPSQATQLVELAELRYDFFTATSGEPFAVPKPGHGPYVARMLRGGRDSLRAELANAYVGNHGRVPSSQATADALLVLEGRARCGARVNLALRVARNGPDLVLDLGDDTGRVVVVKPDSWSIVDRSPVLFRRSDLTGTLPEPIRGGSLGELRNLLNITDGSWPLLIGCQVANLMGHIPHPILALQGEHGCGKSTVLRITASVIDPSPAQLRTSPRDVEQWAVAASGSWIVALDNVSVIQPWLSDALCRAVTGDGMVRRRLYSDDGLSVLAFRRVVMLSSIDPGALRGDLADRLLPIDLERCQPSRISLVEAPLRHVIP